MQSTDATVPSAASPPPVDPLPDAVSEPVRLAWRLIGLPEARWIDTVLELVCGHAAAVLGHTDPDAVDPRRTLLELGLDSLGAVELRKRLVAATGLDLAPTLLVDHRSG